MKLAHFEQINELNEHVGNKKWADVKNDNFTTKWDFWNDKYMTWDCEKGKMMALVCMKKKNQLKMGIFITFFRCNLLYL